MLLTTTGTIISVGEIKYTKQNVPVRQIHFKDRSGVELFPSCMGDRLALAAIADPGEEVVLELVLSGSAGYNNLVVLAVDRVQVFAERPLENGFNGRL